MNPRSQATPLVMPERLCPNVEKPLYRADCLPAHPAPAVANHSPWCLPRYTLFGAGLDQDTARYPTTTTGEPIERLPTGELGLPKRYSLKGATPPLSSGHYSKSTVIIVFSRYVSSDQCTEISSKSRFFSKSWAAALGLPSDGDPWRAGGGIGGAPSGELAA